MAKVEITVYNVRFNLPANVPGFHHAWYKTLKEVEELKGKLFAFEGMAWRVVSVTTLSPGFHFAECESVGKMSVLTIEFVGAPARGGAH